jgi:hypothetical protein
MLVGSKYSYAVFNTPDGGAGGAPVANPELSPASPPAPNPEGGAPEPTPAADFDAQDNWILDAFNEMQRDDDEEEQPVDPTPQPVDHLDAHASIPGEASPPSAQTVATPGEPAATTPVPGTPAVGVPAQQVGASTQQPVSAAGAEAQPQVGDPTKMWEDAVQQIAKFSKEFTEKLAAEQYQIDEKTADELGFTPEQAKLISKMMAQTHVNIVQSTSQMQAQQLPAYMAGMLKAREENQRRETEFFDQWPQLKQADRKKLAEVFQAVNTLNPGLKGAEWSKKAGEMACMHFGVPAQQPQAAVGSQPPARQQVQVLTPGRVVRPNGALPHLPAGPRTTPGMPVPQKSQWETITEFMLRDESGEFDN